MFDGEMVDAEDGDEEQMLVNEIHQEIRKIRQSKALLDNNDGRNDISSPIHKALVENNSFTVSLEAENLAGCSVTKLNPIQDLLRDLKSEVEFVNKEIFKLVKRVKEFEDFSARLDKNTENLELMLEASNNSQVSSKKLDVVEKNIKQRFLKEKRELKTVITTLFPDNLDIQDLIAQVTEYYFTEGADKYMQMEDSDKTSEQIEFLLRTEMFEVNPNNQTQIKLADLL